jgi:hypothetical protein
VAAAIGGRGVTTTVMAFSCGARGG